MSEGRGRVPAADLRGGIAEHRGHAYHRLHRAHLRAPHARRQHGDAASEPPEAMRQRTGGRSRRLLLARPVRGAPAAQCRRRASLLAQVRPAKLLFQLGRRDEIIPRKALEALTAAASEPKDVRVVRRRPQIGPRGVHRPPRPARPRAGDRGPARPGREQGAVARVHATRS